MTQQEEKQTQIICAQANKMTYPQLKQTKLRSEFCTAALRDPEKS
jgi:hypothetical protein